MIIRFTGEYKSLKTFESENLDNFSVITGKNGCGKSQLIELIGLKASKQISPLLTFDFEPEISNIQLEGIENSNLTALNNSNWKVKIDQYITEFNKFGKNTKLLAEALINNNIWLTSADREPFFEIRSNLTNSRS